MGAGKMACPHPLEDIWPALLYLKAGKGAFCDPSDSQAGDQLAALKGAHAQPKKQAV